MKILTSLAISLTLVACASGSEPAKVDVFTDIAKEWQGAQINEMIDAWGDPKILNQASSSGGDGTATWTHFAGAWPAGISGAARRMRSAEARIADGLSRIMTGRPLNRGALYVWW